jgi:GNAT superfamily N-acetyltransferase
MTDTPTSGPLGGPLGGPPGGPPGGPTVGSGTALRRTDSADPDFSALVAELDAELAIRDGDDHVFYAQFNRVSAIRHVVVAYTDGGVPVACGAIKPFEAHAMEVKRMFTAAECRGKGVASRVLRELEAWARELGADRCVLETGLKQPEAIALYTKNGYERIANYGQYAGVENSVCFAKDLVA